MRQRIGQAGLRGARVVGKYPAFSRGVVSEGVVIAVHYIDDSTNVSKTFTEYDVKDLRTGQIYPNARRMDATAGMDDGSDNVLRPAQKLIGATSPVFDPKVSQLSQSDGDRVQVAFSYGAQHTPIITAVLPHPKLTYGTTRAQGLRRFETHKGTSIETKQDGTYQIKRGDTTITLNTDETIAVVHKSGATLQFFDDGSVQLTPAGGKSFFIGEQGASENLVLGQQLKSFLNTLLQALLTATFNTSVGPTTPMLPPSSATLTQLQGQLDSLLSQMSFTTNSV